MDQFATQTYYDSIVSKIIALGFRFVARVQIDHNDSPYYIPAKAARISCFTFDVPGRAVFFNLYHNEHTEVGSEEYSNHWYITGDYDFGSWGDILEKIKVKYSDRLQDESVFEVFHEALNQQHKNSHYSVSARYDECYHFKGDVKSEDLEILVPEATVVQAIQELHDARIGFTMEKFSHLPIYWVPSYTFSGQSDFNISHMERHAVSKKLDDIYWGRFGDGRKVLREKVNRIL